MKEHASNASTPRLRLPAQCLWLRLPEPMLFGSIETLCELVILGHSEENIRSLDLGQSAGGMVGVRVLCWRGALGCKQHTLGAGSSRAQASCLQHLIFLLGPAGSQCNTSLQDLLLWLLWLSVWEPQARCQCACGYEKQCPHASLTRNQPLGSCPSNHIAGQRACRTPPFPTATTELPEPAASEGLAPQGLGIPNFSSMNF